MKYGSILNIADFIMSNQPSEWVLDILSNENFQ